MGLLQTEIIAQSDFISQIILRAFLHSLMDKVLI